MKPIEIGDRVTTLDRKESGTVAAIRTYAGMGDKLLVDLSPPLAGTLLLAIELWQKV
jgi:hypothetical protein